MILLAIIGGWVSLWLLFALLAWALHRRLNVWALIALFIAHGALYAVLFKGLLPAEADSLLAAAGWFLVGPLLGGAWLTIRFTRSSKLRKNPEGEDVPVAPIRVALTTGLLDLVVTTGTAVPLFLGTIYLVLRVAGLVP